MYNCTIRMAQLAPTGTVCKSKRQCLKIIICPMALGELQINCIVAFKVCPQRGQRGLSTPDQTCNSLCICVSLIKTGESAMASTQREPEQKKEKKKKKQYRGEISQACRIDLLDCGCVSLRSQCLSFTFSPPPLFHIWESEHVLKQRKGTDYINLSP